MFAAVALAEDGERFAERVLGIGEFLLLFERGAQIVEAPGGFGMSRFVQAVVQLDGLACSFLRIGVAGLIEVDASLVVQDVGNF